MRSFIGLICVISLGWHLVSELSAFWSIGFNYIDSNVPINTYRDSLNDATNCFHLLGTNAVNVCKLDEFEKMAKRVRENSGHIRLILAHPESTGLREAARGRDKREDLYRDQSIFALGKILELSDRAGIKIDIRLYMADNIEELPIFRIMIINHSDAIASIAVYGRDDHGKSLPQFYAYRKSNPDVSHKSMYSVLCRYMNSFYDVSSEMSDEERGHFLNYWHESRVSPEAIKRLEI